MERAAYQRIKEVFYAAAELPGGAVETFLESECGEDAWLRDQVQRLLIGTRRTASWGLATSGSGAVEVEPEPEVPERLGGYRIVGELGRGGMGVVYRAEDLSLQRPVAIKVLRGAVPEQVRAALLREARAMASLAHPHIATVHALEESEGTSFVVLELVEGQSLDQRLLCGPMAVADVLRLAHQLTEALAVAHSRGIVHLDLKPGNLMLTPEGRLKVLDFGLARTRESMGDGSVAGTPGYMSPEQLDAVGVDERSDLWAVGCVLYECLTGRPAIRGETLLVLVAETMHGAVDLESLPAETPAALRELIAACLDRDRERRPRSATDLRRAVDAAVMALQRPAVPDPLAAIRPRVPRAMAGLLGRDALLEELRTAVTEAPLVTLVGFGGSGKTRLALELVRQLTASPRAQVVWVELGALDDPASVWPTLASALEVVSSEEEVVDRLLARLREHRPLVVLDNCEHLIGTVSEIVDRILTECPAVHVLATSREELAIAGERRIEVPPLEVPATNDPDALRASPALDLLCQRARAQRLEITEEELPLAAELVRRLDGIPLAIELAAGRLPMLGLREVLARLDEGMQLLQSRNRSLPTRQRTLRATLEWSYQLLEPTERSLLARLSLFAEGWTLHAAESACSGDGIESWEVLDLLGGLLAKSLVTICPGMGPGANVSRYRLLEAVREFAREKLAESGDIAPWRARFVNTMLDFAEEARSKMRGAQLEEWLERIDAAHPNLVAAIEAGLADRGDPVASLRLAAALWNYWATRGMFVQGTRILRESLERAGDAAPTAVRARACMGVGSLALGVGAYDRARAPLELARELAKESGETGVLANAILQRGVLAKSLGDHDSAITDYEEAAAMFRQQGDLSQLAAALANLATLRRERGETDESRRLFEEGLEAARAAGDPRGEASNLAGLGTLLLESGAPGESRRHYERAIEIDRQVGNPRALASVLGNLALAAFLEGADDESIALLEESLAIRSEMGDRRGETIVLLNLINHGVRRGEIERARNWLARALDWTLESMAPRFLAYALESAASLRDAEGMLEEVGLLYGAGEAIRERTGLPLPPAEAAERATWVTEMRNSPVITAALQRGRAMPMEQAIEILRHAAGI